MTPTSSTPTRGREQADARGLVLGGSIIGSFWNLCGVLADVRAYSFWD